MPQFQLFFDLDRTLWDFETNSKKALDFIFHKHELDKKVDHFIQFHHHYQRINADLWKKYGKGKITKEALQSERFKLTLEKLNISDDALAEKLGDDYIHFSPYQTTLLPNAITTLEKLQQLGYKMHIITNGFKEAQHIKLENSGLRNFFDLILCSEEVGVTKPNRAIFEYALKQTNGKPNNSVMIGDDFHTDIIGALNAGWQAIHFDPEEKYTSNGTVIRVRDLSEIIKNLPFLKL